MRQYFMFSENVDIWLLVYCVEVYKLVTERSDYKGYTVYFSHNYNIGGTWPRWLTAGQAVSLNTQITVADDIIMLIRVIEQSTKLSN